LIIDDDVRAIALRLEFDDSSWWWWVTCERFTRRCQEWCVWDKLWSGCKGSDDDDVDDVSFVV
jgi:hypothetical protein